MDSALASDMAPIFEDLSQIEKLSEIKPPLVAVFCMAEKSARLVDSRPEGSFTNYVYKKRWVGRQKKSNFIR